MEKSNIDVTYLLDDRIANNHPSIKGKDVFYIKGGMYNRHLFYKKHRKKFNKVFCFANFPPTIKLQAEVMVYFQNRLFLNYPKNSSFYQEIIFNIKSGILGRLSGNADKWIVQSSQMKIELINRFRKVLRNQIIVAPFYPPIRNPVNILRKEHSFLYVSGGAPHKNHIKLLEAFKIFFDRNQLGELHVTVGEQFKLLTAIINEMRKDGYPVTNLGNISRDKLGEHYYASKFLIFPSYAESFGLGLIEAMDCGCVIIGSDLPFLHAVCDTPFVFDPHDVNSIVSVMEIAIKSNNSISKNLSRNNIDEIISLLK
ncbi:MAG TPA: glycosyltransferase [Hanamia sp.]